MSKKRRKQPVDPDPRSPDGHLVRPEFASSTKSRVRRLTIIEEWYQKEFLTKREFDAACLFFKVYTDSRLSPHYASLDLMSPGGGSGDGPEWVYLRAKDAANEYRNASVAAGPRATPVIHALACEFKSLRDLGYSGSRSVEARAIVQVGLSVMASYFDHSRRHKKGLLRDQC